MYYLLNSAKSVIVVLICLSASIVSAQVASFDYLVENGASAACAPVTVQFNNTSTGNITANKWTIDGSTFSTQENPIRIIVVGGSYTVCLEVTGSSGATNESCQDIIINDPPEITLTLAPSPNCNPNEVVLYAASNVSMDSIFWDFGDGNTLYLPASTDRDTQYHVYPDEGTYSVTAIVNDVNGCQSTQVEEGFVVIESPYRANFNANPRVGCTAPLEVTFNNSSTNTSEYTFVWDFGDGSAPSTDINPTHTYNSVGTYNVQLTATEISTGCVYTESKANYVSIGENFADFTATIIDDGDCGTTTVQFTLAGDILSATWNFGDGSLSTELNPTYTYTTQGCFTPFVKVVTADGCAGSKTADDCIQSNGSVSVNYTASGQTVSCDVANGTTIDFAGDSDKAIAWLWDFGGQGIDSVQNPSFTFTNEGTFPVTLTVTYPDGCQESISHTTIELQGTQPYFNANYREGCAPLTISFQDFTTSSDPIVAWEWDFGFTTSTDQNPVLSFPDPGSYNVQLTVTTASGCTGTRIVDNFINLGSVPTLDFVADPVNTCVEEEVVFTNNSSDNVQLWEWDFGDGGSSNEFEPQHEYQDTGTFDVMLIGIDNNCRDTLILEEYVTINAPIADFNFEQVCGGIKTIHFRDTSIAPDSWMWDFGDGTTSTQQHPTHNYTTNGTYNVTLRVTNTASGCEHEMTQSLNIGEAAVPVFSIPVNPVCLGDTVQIINTSQNAVSYDWSYDAANVALITNSISDPEPLLYFPRAGQFGGFALTVTDENGCVSTYNLPDIITVSDINADFSISEPTGCGPYSINFTDASSTNSGNSITDYLWDFGDGSTSTLQNPVHDFQQSGHYTVSLTVTNDNGCTATTIRPDGVIVDLPVSGFTFNVDDCDNAIVSFSNTTTSDNDVTYLWDFGDGTTGTSPSPTHTFPTQDTYIIELTTTNSFGCSSSFKDTLDLVAPVAAFSGDNLYKSCPDPPLVTNFTDESTGAVSWVWDFGDGSPTTNLQNPSHSYGRAGSYTVCLTITNEYGCMSTECKTDYIVIDGPTGSFTFAPTGGCAPLEVTFNATGTNVVEYNWDFGDGGGVVHFNNSNTESATHTYTALGQHTPVVIIKDASGCRVPVLPEQPLIVESINVDFTASDTVFCEGSTSPIRFTPVFADSTLITSVEWSFPGSDLGSSTDMIPPQLNYSSPGSYPVTLKASSTYCQDSVTKLNYIVIHPKPSASFTYLTTDDGCEPETIQFQDASSLATGTMSSWSWDNGDGNIDSIANPSFDYATAGNFAVRLDVVSDQGCSDSFTEVVSVSPGVIVAAGEGAYLCIGERHTLSPTVSGTSSPSYQWSPADGLSCTDCPNPVAEPVVSTTYTLTVSSPEGCIGTDTVTVSISPYSVPDVGLVSDTFVCRGEIMQLIAQGGRTTYDYQWDESRTGLSCYEHCFNPVATPEVTTTYVVTVTGEGGCVSVDSTTIEVIGANLNLLGEDRTICTGGSVELNVTGGSNPRWSPPNYLSCTDCPNPTAAPISTYTYRVTVDYDRGCEVSEDIVVNVQTLDDIDAGQDTSICPGTSATLNGIYSSGMSQWMSGGNTVASNTATPEVSPTTPTTYYLHVTDDLCTLTDSVRVDILEAVDISGGVYHICEGESVQVEVSGNASQYSWSPSEGLSNPNISNPVAAPTETTMYEVTGTAGECAADVTTVTVNVHAIRTPSLPENIKFGLGDEVRLNAEVDNDNNYAYSWSPTEGLSCIVCPKTLATPDSSTTYWVEITDVDYGCKDTASVSLELIIDCEEESIIIPTAFTPNDDGNNDVFYIRGTAEMKIFRIFDRWGHLIFETTDKNNGWDGRFQGHPVNRGVYIYYVESVCRLDGSNIIKTGDITVLK